MRPGASTLFRASWCPQWVEGLLAGVSMGVIGAACGAQHKGRPRRLCADARDRMSAQQRTFLGWAVIRQELVNAAHLRLTADRTEAVVDALVRQEGIQIRDVGLRGVF